MASSSREVIRQAADLRPDLALLDIHLEGKRDGIDAAAVLRQEYQIPVVFLTAYADAATLQRARSVEPFGYLVKPFTERDLHTTIQVALGQARSDRLLRRRYDDLEAILNVQQQGTILIDPQQRVTFVNRAAAEMLGILASEAPGCPWESLFQTDPATLARIGDLLQEAPATAANRLPRLTLGRRSLAVEVEVLRDPRDERSRIIGRLHNVSRLSVLQAKVEAPWRIEKLLGKSSAMQHVFGLIRDFAQVELDRRHRRAYRRR